MKPSRIRLAAIAALAAAAAAVAAQVHTQPWPPGVQQVAEDSPPLSPQDAMKTFYMPPGYSLELVASEPMVQDPVVIDFDADGRMWVIEMIAFHYPDVQSEKERDPICRVIVLEDTNDDGKMDKRTVFAENLVLPRALKVLDRGVLIGEPPNLWLMRDTNGDLKADTRELVTDTYGRRDANPEHNANSLLWAMDNWIYTAEHTGYLRLKNGRFELAPTLPRGQWGVTQDDAGRIYRNTNSNALYVDIVPIRYYLRHPALARTRGMYESLQDGDVNTVWPVRPNRGVNRGYQFGQLREDGTLARYTAVGSPTIYRGDRLPAELAGNVFLAESAGNLVGRLVVSDDGTTLRARRGYQRAEFLASTDERFRPVWLSSAPDGTLYVVDMYRGVIQYRDLITEYLQKWIVAHDLEKGIGFGRIYRVVHTTTRRDRKPALSRATPAQLVAALSHPNGWRRDTAQQLLVQRRATSAVPALKQLVRSAPLARTRVHALWTLDGMDAVDAADVMRSLEDANRDVRTAALRISERWLATDAAVQAGVVKRVEDPDWNVRRQLAATLGELRAGQREAPIARLLEQHGDDPVTVDAALSGLRGSEPAVLDLLLQTNVETPQRSAALTMLAATIVRGGNEAAIAKVFDAATEQTRTAWQRGALMHGAEIATLGTPPPGTPARGRGAAAANAPCETCPGGRGGPGGDRAFPLPGGQDAQQATDIFFGANPIPPPVTVRLTREPALTRLAASDPGDLGQRATTVLAKVEWPGKPGGRATAAPLTAVEQQRFAAGTALYASRCQGCHQEGGQGQPGLASPLVNAAFVVGPPAVAARILLHGKEGPVGLMPPLGAAMTDDEVAAVLTYIRRAWGNTASAIDPNTIRSVRAETSARTRPWSSDELAALANGGGR
jgi:mono/diheme cytochrome c family protein